MKAYKLNAGINSDYGRGPQVTRKAINEQEVWVRQLTWEDGVEASITMWADGTVLFSARRMNSGETLHQWRSRPVPPKEKPGISDTVASFADGTEEHPWAQKTGKVTA